MHANYRIYVLFVKGGKIRKSAFWFERTFDTYPSRTCGQGTLNLVYHVRVTQCGGFKSEPTNSFFYGRRRMPFEETAGSKGSLKLNDRVPSARGWRYSYPPKAQGAAPVTFCSIKINFSPAISFR